MARPLRIELAGGLYHVTSRGDRREDIYLDDDDRAMWLELLGDVCERYNWRVHAWCQMSNHYHLVVETIEGNLSSGMRQLNGVYTQRHNRRHSKSGHVYQGRYKAILVERDSYLLELTRYVVLNPVRAEMVPAAGDWVWSSYHATALREIAPSWLNVSWSLRQFHRKASRAAELYRNFVREGVGIPPIWESLRSQVFLGGDQFVEHMQSLIGGDGNLREVPRAQRRGPVKPLEEYLSVAALDRNRDTAIVEAYRSGAYTQQQIADAIGLHYSTVSRALKLAGG